MIVGDAFQLSAMAPPIGFGINSKLPWEGPVDVFGLGDEEHGCSCPVLNAKNVSMLLAGSLISWFGIKTASASWNLIARVAGGFIAGYGAMDIASGAYKKYMKAPEGQPIPAPKAIPMPVPQAVPDNDPSKNVSQFYGLGSEWYANDSTNEYLNRFANALRPKCGCGMNGVGQCYSCAG